MSSDTEQVSFSTALEETFFDAVEDIKCNSSQLVPEVPVELSFQDCNNEAETGLVNTSDTSMKLLNETYSLSAETSPLLDNPLPYLDDAIKSIQVLSSDPVIYLRNSPPAPSSTLSQNPKQNFGSINSSDLVNLNIRETHGGVCTAPTPSKEDQTTVDQIGYLPSFPVEFHGVEKVETTQPVVDAGNNDSEAEVFEFRGISDRFGLTTESANVVNFISDEQFMTETEKYTSISMEEKAVSEDLNNDLNEPENVTIDRELISKLDDATSQQVETVEFDVSHEIEDANEVADTINGVDGNFDEKVVKPIAPVDTADQGCDDTIADATAETEVDNNGTSVKMDTEGVEAEQTVLEILEEYREKRKPNPPKRMLTAEEDAARNKWPRMTKEVLRKICKEQKLYQTPYLNDILYLHYRGFGWIENLEDYTGLRCLFLDVNGIDEIAGLEYQTEMRCLFMSKNLIRQIENLDHMVHLDTLDVSHNMISKIENLSMLPVLKKLVISHNKLETLEGILHLRECKALTVVDLQQNRIDNSAVLEEIFAQMPNLRVLYNQGNPFVREVKYYRKNFINQCKELTYLDDRPVFPKDRACAEAFYCGGPDEECRVRKELNDAEHKRLMDSCNWLTERRKKIEAANQEKELVEKARGENLPTDDIHVNPEDMDWLYGAEQLKQPNTAGGDVQDVSIQDTAASAPPVDSMETENSTVDALNDDDASTESEIEEFTPSKVLRQMEEQNIDHAESFSVPIDTDQSDEPVVEVSMPTLQAEKASSKSLFEECDDFSWKSKLLIMKDDYEITESVRARDDDEASPQALVEDVEDGRSEEMERGSSKEGDLLKCQILEAAASVGSTDPKFSNYNRDVTRAAGARLCRANRELRIG
ncbi:Leucine-rich repeat-containing protein 50 [Echinococcus granulosus]|uniref:Leucine-rich repeat-containing protein 50 n=1 Tax=Echinococcus granulosus TaxID=6210 RepID=W6U407_ECHGR|nr:Leucine-rich repeat-containing protein 50 [Echinococcus granulosus]EUB55830.1 Leucine-rich repeat-containing protein 50 [Echinococcus granulosus]